MMRRAFLRMRSSKMARFLLVGGYNTVFGYVVFVALYYWIGDSVHYSVVFLASYVISVTNSYLMQRRFVFSSQSRRMAEFLRFNVVNFAGMVVNMGLLFLAVTYVTPKVVIAQAVALFFTIVFIYAGHSFYSFRISSQDT